MMSDPFREMSEPAKHVVDGLSIMTMLGALVQILPSVAAVLTIIWTAIRIYETDTIRRLFRRKGED
ncbi:hypothetical protein SZ64_07865 [Erythrobacter sp. SG61-1L]|uniref:hypothetical protein n=1 Tax=Erythrobacter sp. SG61-1L TaxID=1603897 RepID=UPI0006C91768|nr:hypothetical protein [Erythrobacter sp. SG61-1L]KPL68042.1 hypothetical protein SZ64_07865 [Erythrobacter sp. SG61-1L]